MKWSEVRDSIEEQLALMGASEDAEVMYIDIHCPANAPVVELELNHLNDVTRVSIT